MVPGIKYCSLLAVSFLVCTAAKAQQNDSAFARLIYQQRMHYELNPVEFCYLQTDKDFYQPGETIWFNAWLTAPSGSKPLSQVIYTDLSDAAGNLLHKAMWKADDLRAQGHVPLPDTLRSGLYRLRSYTLWMLNHPVSIQERMIFVLGRKDQHLAFASEPTPYTVQFFPEGGQLTAGVPNRLALRISDLNGLPPPVHAKVHLTTSNKAPIQPLLLEQGIGLLEWTPDVIGNYELELQVPGQSPQRFAIPPISSTGASLQVSNLSPTKVFVQLYPSDVFRRQHPRIVFLAQQEGRTVQVQPFNLEDQEPAFVLQKKNLVRGPLQVTVFSPRLEPLAERWIWVDGLDSSQVTVTADTLSTEPKGMNTWTLRFQGLTDARLSLAVIPADLPAPAFLLNPDAGAYSLALSRHNATPFMLSHSTSREPEQRNLFLDALYLTLQPNRFSWNAIQQQELPPLSYFFETGISVRGVLQIEKNQPLPDSGQIEVMTLGADSSTIFSTTRADAAGTFAVNDLHFRKQAKVYVHARGSDNRKRRLRVDIKPGYADTLTGPLSPPLFRPQLLKINNPQAAAFIQSYAVSTLGKELKEIIITGKSRQELRLDSLNNVLTTPLFRESEYTKAPDPNFGYISFAQLFEQEFFGLRFNMGYDRITVEGGTPATGLASNDMVSYYLNEIPISAEELNFIVPSEVVLVKVNRNTNLHLGQMGSGPSVLIYTRQKNSRSGLDAATLQGYSIPLPFRMPDYRQPANRTAEDRRTTLLWIPQLATDANGKASIRFYNNDNARRFRLVITGYHSNGIPFVYEQVVE